MSFPVARLSLARRAALVLLVAACGSSKAPDTTPDGAVPALRGRHSYLVTSTITVQGDGGLPVPSVPAAVVFTMVLDADT